MLALWEFFLNAVLWTFAPAPLVSRTDLDLTMRMTYS